MSIPARNVMVMAFALAIPAATAAGQGSFTGLGDLAGGVYQSQARGVSADGSVVVGQSESESGTEAFVWTEAGGMVGLGDLGIDDFASIAYSCSGDGTVIFGSGTVGSPGLRHAARWSGAPVASVSLGFAATGGYSSVVFKCTPDGLAACGENVYAPPSGGGPPPLPITQAMLWTSAGGMVNLGAPPGFMPSPGQIATARDLSDDAGAVVGYLHDSAFANRPWRWTSAGGMVDLSEGQWVGQALGVSPDGSIVVGRRSEAGQSLPFVWTAAGGRSDPGLLSGFNSGWAIDVSGDGARMIGSMGIIGVSGSNIAAVWDRGIGWRSLAGALQDAGVSVHGWTLTFVTRLSNDGRVIVGYGVNESGQTEAFRAVLPRPCAGDFNGVGGVTVQDIFDFLVAYFAGAPAADINGSGAVTVQDIFDFLTAYFIGC